MNNTRILIKYQMSVIVKYLETNQKLRPAKQAVEMSAAYTQLKCHTKQLLLQLMDQYGIILEYKTHLQVYL